MAPGDVFIALFEYHPNSTGTALFATDGPPLPLRPDAFSPTMLQRTLPGQAGHQSFFSWNGRAFCLYVVLGAHTNRSYLVQSANDVLASLKADAESS